MSIKHCAIGFDMSTSFIWAVALGYSVWLVKAFSGAHQSYALHATALTHTTTSHSIAWCL